jgi:Sulfotransferase family
LYSWLSDGHPHIFMCPVKEPHYFNTDDKRGVQTSNEYHRLFQAASNEHRAIGEASVWYLSSATAVENILEYRPDAKFIVMLRSPVEMAQALHAEMVLSGHENLADFGLAWDLQEQRRNGRHLPPLTWARRRLLYGDICSLGAQLERLLAKVPQERVLSILLEDLSVRPREEYRRVLEFLGLGDDGRTSFPVMNRARSVRWPALTRAAFIFIPGQEQDRRKVRLQHLGAGYRIQSVATGAAVRVPRAN